MIKKLAVALSMFIATQEVDAQAIKSVEVSNNPNALNDTSKRSIPAVATGKIGKADVTVSYHSPAVRKRVIWGGLVSYGEVWVTGAHSATNITIDRPFVVDGKTVPKGQYALFTIPGEKDWTLILNKNWKQHLADDYDAKDDVLRVSVKPVIKDTVTERLQYFVNGGNSSAGTIAVEWEKVRIELPVKTL